MATKGRKSIGASSIGRTPEKADSPSTSDMLCDPCLGDGDMTPADGFCVNCNDFLCSVCYKSHRKSKASKHHDLKGKVDMPPSRPTPANELEKCPEHKRELVTYFCKSHDRVLCRFCKCIDHRSCIKVDVIDDICQDFTKTGEVGRIRNKLKSLQKGLDEIRNITKGKKIEIEDYYQNMINEMRVIRDKDLEMMAAIDSTCDAMSPQIKSMEHYLKIHRNDDRIAFLLVVRAKSREHVLNERLVSMKTGNTISKYGFVPSVDSADIAPDGVDASEEFKSTCKSECIEIGKIGTTSDANRCTIRGLQQMSEHRFVLTDSGNSKIKLVDMTSHTVISELRLDTRPHDLTKIDDNNIALTTWTSCRILIVAVSDTLAVIKTIEGKELRCSQGIVRCENTLVLSNCGLIQILDLEGIVKLTIENKDEDDNVIFGDIHYVTYNSKSNTLYLSDQSRDKIHSMTMDGTILSTFTHEQMKKPNGIAIGSDGTVFVCSHGSGRIYEIAPDLSKGRILFDWNDGISSPCSIMYSGKEHKLYVGSWYSNKIQIFKV